ncbi:POLQ, partial [Cordylochernes scorpioides]
MDPEQQLYTPKIEDIAVIDAQRHYFIDHDNNIWWQVIQPLLRQQRYSPENKMYRVHGQCEYFTATGRISMQEPNLQCVPRDFDLLPGHNLCLRDVFIAQPGCVLVAGDYSQLELRMLAHLSSDTALIDVLNRGTDVFIAVASRWKNKEEHLVTDSERQHAKQICYGIIYGMGLKTLAAQLGVTETEALQFMSSFKSAYPTNLCPASQRFLRATVNQCRSQGYVETIRGRRRPLPGLSSANAAVRSAAERQAINTLVQGSAADLVKLATVAAQRSMDSLLATRP